MAVYRAMYGEKAGMTLVRAVLDQGSCYFLVDQQIAEYGLSILGLYSPRSSVRNPKLKISLKGPGCEVCFESVCEYAYKAPEYSLARSPRQTS